MLTCDNAVLVVVDVQGKLARLMHEAEDLFDRVARLVRGAAVLEVPVIATEQNPAGLGPTVDEIRPLLPAEAIPKTAFSCCGEAAFVAALEAAGRRQVLLAGIETHVCVYQTARDLLARGYEVHVVADAVSSRSVRNRDIGLTKIQAAGAEVTSVETALFEMLAVAEGPRFKEILKIVK
ncbi:MAG: hydrolase [Planctomycetes bacterium]|nr:hydrolase [Planctomycetota bacterium]